MSEKNTQAEAPSEREAFALDPLEKAIDAYVADYETCYDGGTHTPDDEERFRIKDAIMGLLADPEWDRLWGEHIAALATQQAGQGEALKRAAYEIEQQAARLGSSKFDRTLIADQLRLLAYELRAVLTTPPAPQQPEALAQQERDREDAIRLLDEVRQCFTRDDDLPDNLLTRIDVAIDAARSSEGGKP